MKNLSTIYYLSAMLEGYFNWGNKKGNDSPFDFSSLPENPLSPPQMEEQTKMLIPKLFIGNNREGL